MPTKISDILSHFTQGNSSELIPILQAVQAEYGYISEESVYEISEYLNIPSSKIYGVATFYAQFRLHPPGRHVINLCTGTACHVKGSEKLIPVFEQELKCKAGETTKDGRFTLNLVACLGACALSPVVNIDSDFYGNLTAGEIKKILRKYK
ncbi:NADH-quinone oxidoreductase subunit NuoE [Candidatus Harpocratesius sp.]